MTTPREPQVRSKNEAAERLRERIRALPTGNLSADYDLDAALAWERRRTVELLQEIVDCTDEWERPLFDLLPIEITDRVRAILTESEQSDEDYWEAEKRWLDRP